MRILSFANKFGKLIIKKTNQKTLFFVFVAFLILVIAIEMALQIVRLIINLDEPTSINKKLSLSIYKNKEWAESLLKEHEDNKELDFDQYVGWKRREYHGQFINIGRDGTRKTSNPTYALSTLCDSVYVFGGSTIWGDGVRDDYTVPSCLSKILNQHGYKSIVKNYGERGYTFTQGMMRLILLLKEGHRPRLVIFYDGVNEVFTAYHHGQAGIIAMTPEIQSLLDWKRFSLARQIRVIVKEIIVRHSMIYHTVDKLIDIAFRRNTPSFMPRKYEKQELDQLSKDIVAYYIASLDIVEKLSKTFGFEYICFWQPVIFFKNKLTEEEKNLDELVRDQQLNKLYLDTYEAIRMQPLANFHNLSDILDDHTETLYFDFCHLSEEGNEIVANEIFKVMGSTLAKER